MRPEFLGEGRSDPRISSCHQEDHVTTITTTTPPIVLIHGLWLSSLSWEHWVERFKMRGCEVHAPNWPGMDGGVEAVRRDPSTLDNIGIAEIVEHYERFIKKLDRTPIIMGHSFGGLVAQILLDHGLGIAGVAIDPAPVKGVYRLPYSTLKASFPVLKNPANNHRTVMLTPEEFHYAFTNTITLEQSEAYYQRYAVPGPGRPLFQAAFANFSPSDVTRVDFHNDKRAPLLIIAGGADHTVPPSVSRSTAKVQHRSKAITALKEFPDRPHFILGLPGWEEVADFALAWSLAPRELPVPS
jgi:pimeloyl-ACP methyl ester carboxylesterase